MLATLKFLSDLPLYNLEKPYKLCRFPEVPQSNRTNFQFTNHNNIKLEDVRGQEKTCSIDRHGFTFVSHVSSLDLKSQYFEHQTRDEAIVNKYLQECIELVKREMGVNRVVCIDWRVRQRHSNALLRSSLTLSSSDAILLKGKLYTKTILATSRYHLLLLCIAVSASIAKRNFLDFTDRVVDFSEEGGRDKLTVHLPSEEVTELTMKRRRVQFFK